MSNFSSDDETIMDEDTPEDEDNGGLYPYDPTKEDIDIREDPHSVFELIRKYKQEKLIIDPDFQRNLVWEPEQKSRFIESVILNFPLPPWYVNQAKDGRYIIVDGLQRTTTLYQFIEDPKFELKGLKALPNLNGQTFDSLAYLEGNYQAKIEDKKITLYVIKPSVSSKVVYDIFNRINTGGTKLTQQEVRNCIFSGKSTQLLKELSETDDFKKAIDYGISPQRMKDREVVLRCLAFQIFNYETDYEGDMSLFLEKAMKKINLISDEEIEKLKKNFIMVMKLTFQLFGDTNFRIPIIDKQGNNKRGRINTALLESVAYFFSKHLQPEKKEEFSGNQETIKSNFQMLLENPDYLDAIKSGTNSTAKVMTRFNLAQQILGKISKC